MSKHASTLLAGEAVEILVNKHVIVETVLPGECRVAQKTYKRLYTYHTQHAYYYYYYYYCNAQDPLKKAAKAMYGSEKM